MALFEWQDRFNLNVDKMDEEHKTLVSIMNKLHLEFERDPHSSKVKSYLVELVDFTKKHFAEEEAFMESIAFPDLKSHCAIHKRLLDKLDHHADYLKKNGQPDPELFEFLKFWLKSHICGIDMRYAKFSRKAA